MVKVLYYQFMTSGVQIVIQSSAAMTRASMTAADPKSLALLERSWWSKEIRSIAASTLELSNSTTKTRINEDISAHFSMGVMGRNNAIGVSTQSKVSSCRKALSSLKAYTMPHQEFLAACQALVSPRLPLWGF